ncbi:MAG: hypothetical protein L0H63_01515 [Nitrococcus sp.]|nr:hypothetical protein [Nitrococcus sp.]
MTKTLLAAISLLALTVVHHLYGAAIYATPWRHHVALIALPVLFVLILAYGIHRWRPSSFIGRSFMWVFIVLTLLVPVAWIGLFEGGYNHVLKNALFFAGLPRATFDRLFPPPAYELPNDLWFEVTGVLQFFIALYVVYCLLGLWKERRGGGCKRR